LRGHGKPRRMRQIDSTIFRSGLPKITGVKSSTRPNAAQRRPPSVFDKVELRKRPQFSESGGGFSGAVGIPSILKAL
jgi:hypothetical protein